MSTYKFSGKDPERGGLDPIPPVFGVGNQSQQDRHNSAIAEVGRSRFFAGVPGRPARVAPAIRPLPFFTPGSQRSADSDDDGTMDDMMESGVRMRVGNIIIDMPVAQVGEEGSTEKVLDTVATVEPTGLLGKAIAVWNWTKSLFGGTTVSDQAREDKLAAYNAVGGDGDKFKIAMNNTFAKLRTLGFQNMMTATAAVPHTVNWYKRLYALYSAWERADAQAHGYLLENGVWVAKSRSQLSLTERVSGIDAALARANEFFGEWNQAVAEMKQGITDPLTWSQYKIENGKYYADKFDGSRFVLVEVPVAEVNRRKNLAASGAEQPPDSGKGQGSGQVVVPNPQKTPIMKIGSKGTDVKLLQAMLQKAGFDPKGVDGIYGPNTAAAVKAFQASVGMTQTGEVANDMLAALGSIVALLGGGKTTIPGAGDVTVSANGVVVVTPEGGTPINPGTVKGGGGDEGGQTESGEVSIFKKPLFWGIAIGSALLLGGGGVLVARKMRKK